MTPARRKNDRASSKLAWRPDARNRLRALLPELLVSIVATTCLSVVLVFSEGVNVPVIFVAIGLVQALVQTMLYVIIYLVEDDSNGTIAYWFWAMLAVSILYGVLLPVFSGLPDVGGNGLRFDATISFGFGTILFYLTRTRLTFVMLLLEMLVLVDSIGHQTGMLLAHFIGFSSTVALFVMRSSATSITLSRTVEDPADEDAVVEGGNPPKLGIYGQIAVVGLAVCALCLALALAGTVLVGWTSGVGTMRPGTSGTSVSVPSESSSGAASGHSSGAQSGHSQTTGSPVSGGQSGGAASAGSSGGDFGSALVSGLLLALAVLPIPVRLLMRRLRRLSLAREPQAARRISRVYIAIISRLEAAGIVRDEAFTPSEFLVERCAELEELTEGAGVTLDDWTTLTEAYERARYADLDPTESELETCWRIYDALPSCVRKAKGWYRYLAGAFWRM